MVNKRTGLPILPPIDIKFVDGVPVGFVGMTLEGTPSIVNPAGITERRVHRTRSRPPTSGAALLRLFGIKALVLLIHEGGAQTLADAAAGRRLRRLRRRRSPTSSRACDPEYGIVVSGHTHRFYSCALPNSAGRRSVVTSAGSNGRLVTDIDFTVDRSPVRGSVRANGSPARNVDRHGRRPRPGAGSTPSAKVIADKYRTAVAPIANRVVGAITADIPRTAGAQRGEPAR